MQVSRHGEEPEPLAWDTRTADVDDHSGGSEREAEPVDPPQPDPAPEPDPAPATEPEPEPPIEPDTAPAMAAMLEGMAALAMTMDAVHAQTRDAVRVQRRHAEHVDELHAENQRLRRGELASALAPMVRDVIRLYDEVARLAVASAPEAAEDMALVAARTLDVLSRWGVSDFGPGVGEPFDPALHQGVSRIEDPTAPDGTIAAVRRVGFRDGDGRVIRPADVDVIRPPGPSPAPAPAPAAEGDPIG